MLASWHALCSRKVGTKGWPEPGRGLLACKGAPSKPVRARLVSGAQSSGRPVPAVVHANLGNPDLEIRLTCSSSAGVGPAQGARLFAPVSSVLHFSAPREGAAPQKNSSLDQLHWCCWRSGCHCPALRLVPVFFFLHLACKALRPHPLSLPHVCPFPFIPALPTLPSRTSLPDGSSFFPFPSSTPSQRSPSFFSLSTRPSSVSLWKARIIGTGKSVIIRVFSFLTASSKAGLFWSALERFGTVLLTDSVDFSCVDSPDPRCLRSSTNTTGT